ncbi:hypothetical protein Phpb_01946 [Photorhabdus namnaonensis]|uniref:Uncharacterized protein n=1 Tax=Photorhabdus namnaonensis TaxID=1851568 RepID=A0A1B8YIW3_9GAMM|nr:hypothetical protein Phpb_01946 [Photorhabdus namnaonensis]
MAGLAENGLNYVRDSTRDLLAQFGIWFNQAGKWVCEEVIDPISYQDSYAFSWVSEQTGKIVTWMESEIKARWQTVQQGSDIILEELKNISWMQILKDLGISITLFFKQGYTPEKKQRILAATSVFGRSSVLNCVFTVMS